MKKILSLILAGLMSISCAAFVAADDAAAEATADPYQEYAIEFLANYGIFKGGEGLTNEDLIQRYQMALFVARISTGWVDDTQWEDGSANNSTFDDINDAPANLYLGALSYANQNGIIEGYSATKFAPYDTITYRDALTMVVRTLGYKGLNYPWGYIQTAVELGLTEGIDAAYTDELTRGEVAVIIYNAMFAATKSGETLGKSIFDVDFGWKNIVVVATDEGTFYNAGKRTASGLVGFKVLNDDMTLSATTYVTKASDLGLAGHEEELELGCIYAALFEIDGDLAKVIDADCLNFATVINNGITDNEGAAYAKLPILTALEPYSLVSKTAAGSYMNWVGTELFVYEIGTYTWYAENNMLVGIDYNTGDIMKWNGTEWVVAWFYNELLDRYYQYDYDAVGNQIYLNWMSDAEFAAWYAEAIKYVAGTETQYVLKTNFSGFGTNPYAKLRMYDTDADGLAEIANYKDYAIGIFSNTTLKCTKNANGVNHSAGVNMPAYQIVGLDGGTKVSQFVEAGHEAHDNEVAQFAWMNVAADVEGFANADGSYNNGVVLYNWNKTTGELEIVKYIPEGAEGTDADSYIFTGILQAYSTKGATITVDGEKYAYGYDALVGNTLVKGDLSIAARSKVAYELDEYLMQYVKVLVVDGLVVDVDLLNASSEILVVLDYAGITSDGYIAVYAYSTADGALKLYKINSYNGWKQGDYRYNPQNAKEDGAFDMGCVYVIKSYEATTNSYGVYTYSINDLTADVADSTIKMELGYRVITGAYAGTEKAAASVSYIIITESGIPYIVNGVASNGWTVTGKILYKAGGKVVMFADKADINGFDANAHEVGFVMYDKANGRVLEAAYDDAQVEDIYLLGSTVSEVCVFNMLTGKFEYVVTSTNIDLEDGAIYMTIGNTIVRLFAADYEDFKALVVDNANLLEHVYAGVEDLEKALTKKDVCELFGWVPATSNQTIINDAVNGKVDEILYYQIVDGNVKAITITEGYEYDGLLVYNTATKDVIVYIEYFDKIGE